MKPITYWIQNEAIDQLVAEYGDTLHVLEPETRRELIAYLAAADDWDWGVDVVHPLERIYPLVEPLTRHEKDLLMEAIAATLTHHGNPWVEGARKMVAIEQAHKKEGIPLPIGMPTAAIDA